MRYTLLDPRERSALLDELASMPAFLRAALARLTPAQAVVRGPGRDFAPVEHVWHLADLERDGYALRVRRIAGGDWDRAGTKEGVGAVSLRDVPAMMIEHDRGHRHEIEQRLAELGLPRGGSMSTEPSGR